MKTTIRSQQKIIRILEIKKINQLNLFVRFWFGERSPGDTVPGHVVFTQELGTVSEETTGKTRIEVLNIFFLNSFFSSPRWQA